MHQLSAKAKNISIHALLAESDLQHWILVPSALQISIHALLAESDPSEYVKSSP